MPPTDALVLFEEPDGLRQPVLIVAFSGWNDAAESATTAARYLGQLWPSRPLASIDPEERRVGKECMVQCRSRWSPYH